MRQIKNTTESLVEDVHLLWLNRGTQAKKMNIALAVREKQLGRHVMCFGLLISLGQVK